MTGRSKCIRFLAAAIAALLVFSCSGCGRAQTRTVSADNSLRTVQTAGKLVLGLDASFPPMGFTDEDGEIVGFDIDVAREVCLRLGVELVKRPIAWDEKEVLLDSRGIDCIWNGLSVNAARAETMNLSDPYMKNDMVFVVNGSSTAKSMNDLKGRNIGVQRGSSAQALLENWELYPYLTVSPMEDNVALLNALSEDRLDAAFLDSVMAYYTIASHDIELYVLSGNLGEEEYAIGFRKEDETLRNRIQEILYEMQADGSLGRISEKWFGSDITLLR